MPDFMKPERQPFEKTIPYQAEKPRFAGREKLILWGFVSFQILKQFLRLRKEFFLPGVGIMGKLGVND